MTRGFVWGVYIDDSGQPWAKRVDADQVDDPDRGWTLAPGGMFPFPREWLARRVQGIDDTGRTQVVVVATLDAPLWTGAATAFTVEANDGTLVVAQVIGRLGERTRGPR